MDTYSHGDNPSYDDLIDEARKSDDVATAVVSAAMAVREAISFAPLPPGWRAVYRMEDGSFDETPVIGVVWDGGSYPHPVDLCSNGEVGEPCGAGNFVRLLQPDEAMPD